MNGLLQLGTSPIGIIPPLHTVRHVGFPDHIGVGAGVRVPDSVQRFNMRGLHFPGPLYRGDLRGAANVATYNGVIYGVSIFPVPYTGTGVMNGLS